MLTAYMLCGAGALAGAGILQFAVSPQGQRAAEAMRLCIQAFLVLGVGLTHIAFAGPVPGPLNMLGMAVATLTGLSLVAFGLGRLAGEHLPQSAMAAVVALAVVVPPVALAFGLMPMVKTFVTGLALVSLLALGMVRRFLRAPPSTAARLIGLAMVVLAISCLARAAWTLGYNGSPLPHMMHVPVQLQPLLAVLYGVMPLLVATLLLDTVNAQLRDQLRERATVDELTGTLTRRALRERAAGFVAEGHRSRRETAVLMVDLDHFKAVNDRWGHGVGDIALRHAARALQQSLRPDTLLSRYGGEEFVAMVPVDGLRGARLVAERLRLAVAQAPWQEATPAPLALTASVGVSLVGTDESLDQALQRADEALYRAKRDGRNQVQVGLRAA